MICYLPHNARVCGSPVLTTRGERMMGFSFHRRQLTPLYFGRQRWKLEENPWSPVHPLKPHTVYLEAEIKLDMTHFS